MAKRQKDRQHNGQEKRTKGQTMIDKTLQIKSCKLKDRQDNGQNTMAKIKNKRTNNEPQNTVNQKQLIEGQTTQWSKGQTKIDKTL
jgi:hypothetical protein